MTILNKTITYQGSLTKVTSIMIYPQANGSYVIDMNGIATDGGGNARQISASANFPAGTMVLDNMIVAALQKLRQANGLET